jgi:hypothetical protein
VPRPVFTSLISYARDIFDDNTQPSFFTKGSKKRWVSLFSILDAFLTADARTSHQNTKRSSASSFLGFLFNPLSASPSQAGIEFRPPSPSTSSPKRRSSTMSFFQRHSPTRPRGGIPQADTTLRPVTTPTIPKLGTVPHLDPPEVVEPSAADQIKKEWASKNLNQCSWRPPAFHDSAFDDLFFRPNTTSNAQSPPTKTTLPLRKRSQSVPSTPPPLGTFQLPPMPPSQDSVSTVSQGIS